MLASSAFSHGLWDPEWMLLLFFDALLPSHLSANMTTRCLSFLRNGASVLLSVVYLPAAHNSLPTLFPAWSGDAHSSTYSLCAYPNTAPEDRTVLKNTPYSRAGSFGRVVLIL